MATKQRVLIIEDERDLAEAYGIILSKEGYDIKIAQDGIEALDIASEWAADIFLLDLRMPRMSGIEFLKEFRARGLGDPKIIVFTNMDNEAEIQDAFSLGAHRYMLKAWASPKYLAELVSETLASDYPNEDL